MRALRIVISYSMPRSASLAQAKSEARPNDVRGHELGLVDLPTVIATRNSSEGGLERL